MEDAELERLLVQLESRMREMPEDQWRGTLEAWAKRVGLLGSDSWVSSAELIEAIGRVAQARNTCPDPLLRSPGELAVAAELTEELRRCRVLSYSRNQIIAALAGVLLELGLLDLFARDVWMKLDPKIYDPRYGRIEHTDWNRLPAVVCALLSSTNPHGFPERLRDGNGFVKALIDEMRSLLLDRVIADHVFAVAPCRPQAESEESQRWRPNYEILWKKFSDAYTQHFGSAEGLEAQLEEFLNNTLKERSLATLAANYRYTVRPLENF